MKEEIRRLLIFIIFIFFLIGVPLLFAIHEENNKDIIYQSLLNGEYQIIDNNIISNYSRMGGTKILYRITFKNGDDIGYVDLSYDKYYSLLEK